MLLVDEPGEPPFAADAAGPTATSQITLLIGGMTCGACAARIERKLNAIGRVTAQVNLATERATITAPAGMSTGPAHR